MRFHIHLWLIPFSLGAFALSRSPIAATPVKARPAPYALAEQKVSDHKESDQQTDIRVYNRKTGQTIWKSRLAGPGIATWTPDHRAVAIVDDSNPRRLLLWVEGKKVRIFTRLLVPARQIRALTKSRTAMGLVGGDLLAGDAFQQATLSPDKKRLLICSSENETGLAWGELWCLTLASHRWQQVYPEVSEAHWLGPRLARFTKVYTMKNRTGPGASDFSYYPKLIPARTTVR